MAHEKCKGDWESKLKPTNPPKSHEFEGVISISASGNDLKGSHADSDDFPVTCDGSTIRFTRVGKSKKNRIVYTGSFTTDNKISGTYTRTDVADKAEAQSQAVLSGDSGDWEATKPTLLKTTQQQS